MEQKRIANMLKVFTIGVGLIGALFFFVYAPVLIGDLAAMYPEAAFLKWPGIIGVWVIAVFCYIALVEFWKICTRIGKDNSFCNENANSMKRISLLAFLTAVLMILAAIFLGFMNFLGIAYFLICFFAVCIAIGVGVVCLALSALIRRAAQIKEENDLTI